MPSFKKRTYKSMSAADTDWVVDHNDNIGWLANVTFMFPSDISGDVAIQLKPYEATTYSTIAFQTISGDATAVWMGNQHLGGDDYLKITKDVATACEVYVTFDYENMGDGSWQTFEKGEGENTSSSSSSSSSESSSSESSSSSSSSSSNSSESSSSESSSSSSNSSESSSSSSSKSSSSSSSDSSDSSESSSSGV